MTLVLVLIGVVAAVAMSASGAGSSSAYTPTTQKRYKATKPVVVDKQTGQVRLPTSQEIEEMVGSLEALAKRPEDLPQTPAAGGGVAIDLEGGYGGVMLARPGENGAWETRCVFTFAEGAEFLGLEEDNSAQ